MGSTNTKAGREARLAMSSEDAEYSEIIQGMTPANAPHVLNSLIHGNMSPDLFRKAIYDFVLRTVALDNEVQGTLPAIVPTLLGQLKKLDDRAPILLMLLENLRNKKEEDLRLRILEMLGRSSFTTASITGLLYKADSSELVIEILNSQHHTHTDDFIRSSLKLTDPNVLRNISQVLPKLPACHFLNYNSFMFLFESDHYAMRCCFLDIIENLIVLFREQNNVESIRELLELVQERLNDVNFYVRGKALGCIASLFRRECILKDQRNALVREIIGRAKDRTVIVRKKSVNILGQILLNHPFKNKISLERTAVQEPSASKETGSKAQLEEDFTEFVELMETALAAVEILLEYDLKTDAIEIATFIKIAYLLRVHGADRAFRKILGLIFTKDRQVVIDVFKEIIAVRTDAVYEFIDDRAFDEMLKHVELDDKMLYRNFYNDHMALESSYILARLQSKISEENGLVLLRHATDILFASRDENDLKRNTALYRYVLEILVRMKGRIAHNSELLRIASKNIIKMLFFEYSLIKHTVQLFYAVSLNPEKNCLKLLKNLCLCKSTLKILDCVGWVAINQYYLLERLERNLKGQEASKKNTVIESIGSGGLENFRRSLGQDGLTTLRERRKSVEEARRLSLGRGQGVARMSLKFDALAETLKDKTDEEIADFFFFLRENEVLGSESSLLHQFVPLIVSSCSSPTLQVQTLAYLALNRLMLTSSAFFNDHFDLFRASLAHESPTVRNNAAVALHDFIILYGSSFNTAMVFEYLQDPCVNRNIALAIHSLLHKNVIRVRNNATRLIAHLFDPSIGPIVASIVKGLSSSNNIMSILFYETFISTLEISYLEYLCDYTNPNIHESLFLKCLTSGGPLDRIKCLYKCLTISDKFMEEHSYREDVKALFDNNACEIK